MFGGISHHGSGSPKNWLEVVSYMTVGRKAGLHAAFDLWLCQVG